MCWGEGGGLEKGKWGERNLFRAGGRREPSELNDDAIFFLENKRENGYGFDLTHFLYT